MGRIFIIILVLASAILTAKAFAIDYSNCTTEELANMRSTMQDASPEEREAFRAEWGKRLQNMTPEERQKYIGGPDNSRFQPGAGRMQETVNGQGEDC